MHQHLTIIIRYMDVGQLCIVVSNISCSSGVSIFKSFGLDAVEIKGREGGHLDVGFGGELVSLRFTFFISDEKPISSSSLRRFFLEYSHLPQNKANH